MLIRRETPADVPAVRDVVAAAFAAPDVPGQPAEVALVDRLRGGDAWLPELSLVAVGGQEVGDRAEAVDREKVIGHVLCTRGYVGGVPALGLAPLAVAPGHQGRGAGSALVHTVLGAADALGAPLVAVLGSPAYYGRFGFRPSGEYGITPPDPGWAAHFRIRALTGHEPATRGTFRYAPAFDGL